MNTRASTNSSAAVLLFTLLAACASSPPPPSATAATPEGATGEALGDGRYSILVHRPFSVGQKLRVAVEVRQRIEAVRESEGATASASLSQGKQLDLELAGVIEVMGVDDKGRINLAKMSVERAFDKAQNLEIVKAGSVITAERSAEGVTVLVDGKQPTANVAAMLQTAFPAVRPGGVLGDAIMGTEVPKAIGESWDVERNAVVTDLADDGYTATRDEITGTVTLAAKLPCDKLECLEITSKLTAKQVSIGAEHDVRAAGAGVLEVELRMLLPVDSSQPVYDERALTRATFEAAAEAGAGSASATTTAATVQVARDRHATYTLVAE